MATSIPAALAQIEAYPPVFVTPQGAAPISPQQIIPSRDGGAFVLSLDSVTKYSSTGAVQYTSPFTLFNPSLAESSTGYYVAGLSDRLGPTYYRYDPLDNFYLDLLAFDSTGHFQGFKDLGFVGGGNSSTPGWTTTCQVDQNDNATAAAVDSPPRSKFDSNGNRVEIFQASVSEFSPGGQLLWSQDSTGTDIGFGEDCAIGSDNSVYCVWVGEHNETVSRYSSTGTLLWSFNLLVSSTTVMLGCAAGVNTNGNFYVASGVQGETPWQLRCVSSSGNVTSTRVLPNGRAQVFADGSGVIYVQSGQSVNGYDLSDANTVSYSLTSILGSGGWPVVTMTKSGLFCTEGVQPNANGEYTQIASARLTLNGTIIWSNLGTSNLFPAVTASNFPEYDDQNRPVRGCVTANGTTFLVGCAAGGSLTGITAIDVNGKVLFSRTIWPIGFPKRVIATADGGFVTGGQGGLVKISSTGAGVWRQRGVVDFGVDSAGNTLALGCGPTNGAFKVSPTGSIVWQVANVSGDVAAVDSTGSLVFGGHSNGVLAVSRISPSGTLLFTKLLPSNTTLESFDEITTDLSGSSYITCRVNGYTQGTFFGIVGKFDSLGNDVWEQSLSSPGVNSEALGTVCDGAHNRLYLVGWTSVNGYIHMVAAACETAYGQLLWAQQWAPAVTSEATDAAVDSQGNVLIGGWMYSDKGSYDNVLVKLSPDGAGQEFQIFDSGYKLPEYLGGVAADANGNSFLYGSAFGPNASYQFYREKYGPPPPQDAAVSQTVQTTMVAGYTYNVPIKALNGGLNIWTSSAGYKLDCLEPATWGITSLPLTSSDNISYGQTKTFYAALKAPTTPGTYQLGWRMEQNGTQFGTASTIPSIKVVVQTNFASFVGQTVPTSMVAGQTYPVTLQFTNTGQNTWTPALGYNLISVNPGANMNWGKNRLPLVTSSVAPGATATYSGTVIAPAATGTYNFQWQPIQEKMSPYGPFSTNVVVNVTKEGDAARFISQTGIPPSMTAGASFTPSITFMNVGANIWKPTAYGIRSRNPYNNMNWGINYFASPVNVSPGASVTFQPTLIAPAAPGTYYFQWSMMDSASGTLFGDLPPSVPVTVTRAPNAAQFISETTVPTSMAPGYAFSASITLLNTGNNTWDSNYSLCSRNPDFDTIWNTASQPVPAATPTNSQATFTHSFTAPTTPGTYHFCWQMVTAGSFFGQSAPDLVVTVSADAAHFMSRTGPTSIAAGTDFYVSNTMLNTGSTSWSSATGYSMMSVNPNNSMTWARARNFLSGTGTFAPGAQTAIYGLCTAPSVPGTYTMQWQMDKNGVPFGEKTPLLSIVVTQGADDAQFFTQAGIPTSYPHSAQFGAYVMMKNLGTATWDSSYSLVPIGTSNFGVASILAPSTAPGLTGQFSATFTTPATPGTYHFRWRMAHSGVKFGDPTVDVVITVT